MLPSPLQELPQEMDWDPIVLNQLLDGSIQQQNATLLGYNQESILNANVQDKAKYMIMLLQKTAHLSDQLTNKFVRVINAILKLHNVNAGMPL